MKLWERRQSEKSRWLVGSTVSSRLLFVLVSSSAVINRFLLAPLPLCFSLPCFTSHAHTHTHTRSLAILLLSFLVVVFPRAPLFFSLQFLRSHPPLPQSNLFCRPLSLAFLSRSLLLCFSVRLSHCIVSEAHSVFAVLCGMLGKYTIMLCGMYGKGGTTIVGRMCSRSMTILCGYHTAVVCRDVTRTCL